MTDWSDNDHINSLRGAKGASIDDLSWYVRHHDDANVLLGIGLLILIFGAAVLWDVRLRNSFSFYVVQPAARKLKKAAKRLKIWWLEE